MAQIEYAESRQDLLEVAKSHGYEVTADQLVRWHRAGLLPRPRQRSKGKKQGTQSLYPTGTGDQLSALCEIHIGQGEKRLDYVAWRLWWQGYDVSIERVRRLLCSVAEWFDGMARTLRSGGKLADSGWEQAAEYRTRRLKFPGLARARRELGPDWFEALLVKMLQVVSGTYWGPYPRARQADLEQEQDILERGFGIDRVLDALNAQEHRPSAHTVLSSLADESALFREHTFREAAVMSTDGELEETRDRVRDLFIVLGLVLANAEIVLGPQCSDLVPVGETIQDMDPGEQAMLVLLWLMLRLWGKPEIRDSMLRLASHAHMALVQIRSVGQSMVPGNA